MTSFDSSPQLNVWRALLALAVVFVMLATTGWTAIRSHREKSPLQASLSAWQSGHLDGRELPDAESSPHRLAAFFASLTAPQRTRLAHRYPLAVGNMNGAPVELRYRANRIALKQQSRHERERTHDKRLSEIGRHEAGRRMHRFDMLAVKKRHILAFDPEGNGRVAEVFGDLDKAERVSVVVPGVDTNVINFQRTNRRYSAPVGMAESLYDAERAASRGTRTAVIAWADYTAPDGLGLDSATALRAEQGSVRLNALVRSLPGGSTVALVCHSYGSVVCGVAARSLPSRVTDIAVAGSPGMRAESVGNCGRRPGCGPCGTPTTGSRTCPTWRSAGSATAPTRSPRSSGRASCRRPTPRDTAAISSRAPRACTTSPRSASARTSRCGVRRRTTRV